MQPPFSVVNPDTGGSFVSVPAQSDVYVFIRQMPYVAASGRSKVIAAQRPWQIAL
ncbi:hypothetical protein SAMN05192539_103935 [Paraburkholderia diazotrophica]|uniref:Uncharacterized protein n=1 Tax=Paraburkholderia diazotrophica TaxID=667676 RepID=A0A1H7E157_9BURK|nr:hypothetical protein SAMN05192539_103935 [Paraburkholderia diazotrophica]